MSNAVSLFGVENKEDLFEENIEDPKNYLSFFDLQGVVGFQSCKETQDKGRLEEILWSHGADISKPYQIRFCTHRPRTSNIPYTGMRIEYTERTDKEHLLSGIASIEAQLFTKDKSLRDALAALDPRNAANKKKDFTEDSECSVEVYDGGCV
jgi:hypothetical protein